MSSDDYELPELPSDEELGIAGLTEEDFADDAPASDAEARSAPKERGGAAPPGPPPGGGGATPRAKRPDAGPPPARSRWRGPVTLAFLIVAAWASSPQRAVPDPVAANAPDTAFSSGRAMATLVELARRPHVVGSPEHARVRETIVERLRDLGLDPEIQTTVSMRARGDYVRAATVRNIVARVPGRASTGAVLMTAHYDAVPLSSGAGDDGTGVVAILETLRALRAGPPLENDLIVLITDAEELGLLGARAFVDEHPALADVRVVLSVEMRGGAGPSIMFETGADNGWIVDRFARSAPHPVANAVSVDIYRRLPNDTDFTPFRERGVQGLNFAAIGRARVYHQASDVPANIDEATIQHHGVNLLAVARHLGAADLAEVDAPDLAYLVLPGVGVVGHGASWSRVTAAGLAVAYLLLVLLVRARGGSLGGVAIGVVLGAVSIAGAAGAGYALFEFVRPRHPEFGALVPAFYEEGWYLLGLVAVAFTLVSASFAVAGRRFGVAALATGALLLPLVGAVAAAVVVPLGAPNLLWPVAAALVAAGVAVTAPPGRTLGLPAWVASLVLALPVLWILTFVLELVWVAMSIALAAVLAGFAAVVLLLLVPALDGLTHPNRWWAPLAGLAAALAFVGIGVLRAGASAGQPAPTTLLYTLDRDAGVARWATRDGASVTWAEAATDASFGEEAQLEAFRRPGTWRLAPAPALDAPSPQVLLRQTEGEVDARRVDLDIVAPLAAEALTIVLPAESPWSITAIDGRALPAPGADGGAVKTLEHWGVPIDTLTVTLEARSAPAGDVADRQVRFWVLEEHLRPAELLGAAAFQRPDTLMPRQGSDRALIRTPVLVGGGPAVPPVATDTTAAPVPDTPALRPPPDTTVASDTTAVPAGRSPDARQ